MSDPTSPPNPYEPPQQSPFGQPPYGEPAYGQQPFAQPGFGQPGYAASVGWGSESQIDSSDPMVSPDYGGWWRRSIAVLRRAWGPLAAIHAPAALVTLAAQVLLVLQLIPFLDKFQQAANRAAVTGRPDPGMGHELVAAVEGMAVASVIGALVLGIVTAIVELASVRIVVDAAVGAPISFGAALSLGARRFFPLIGWSLLSGPIILLGACCVVVPGIYLAIVFGTLLVTIVAAERGNHIGRVFTLAHKDLGVALSRIATIIGVGILASVFSSIIGMVVGAVANTAGSPGHVSVAGQVASVVIASIFAYVYQVISAPLRVLAYADMRACVEPVSAQVIREGLTA